MALGALSEPRRTLVRATNLLCMTLTAKILSKVSNVNDFESKPVTTFLAQTDATLYFQLTDDETGRYIPGDLTRLADATGSIVYAGNIAPNSISAVIAGTTTTVPWNTSNNQTVVDLAAAVNTAMGSLVVVTANSGTLELVANQLNSQGNLLPYYGVSVAPGTATPSTSTYMSGGQGTPPGVLVKATVWNINDALKVTRWARNPFPLDQSVWSIPLYASDNIFGTPDLQISVTVGGSTKTFLLQGTLRFTSPNVLDDFRG